MTHEKPENPCTRIPAPATFEEAAQNAHQGLARELLAFMSDNAKWWLTPFLLVFGLFGAVLVLGTTGAAPFLYSFF